MLGTLSGWFGSYVGTRERIRKEIDILGAIDSHIQWKLRLLNYRHGVAEEKLDPSIICRDDQCELGKWIHGPTMQHLCDLDGFRSVREKHAHFHAVAGRVVQSVHENDFKCADRLLNEDYSQASREVVQTLLELNQLLYD